MPDKYLSLQAATRYCNYSQEYLSLRARQGKLKAIKFGRNWVTREEWLKEYLGQVETYVNGHINHAEIKKIVLPPVNLPIRDSFPKFLELQFKKIKFPKPALQIRFGFVVVLVFVSLISGIFHGRESFNPVRDSIVNFTKDVSSNISNGVKIAYSDATVFTRKLNQDFKGGIAISNSNFKNQASIYRSEGEEEIYLFASQTSKLGSDVSSFVISLGGVVSDTISDIPQSFHLVRDSLVSFVTDISNNISNGVQVVYQDINSQLSNASQQAAAVGEFTIDNLKDYAQWLVQGYFAANDVLEKNLASDAENLVQWLVQNYWTANDALEKNLALNVENLKKATLKFAREVDKTYQFIVQPWKEVKRTSLVEETRPKPEEGVVMVPYSSEQTAEMKGKLEKAFSDNVEVKPDETGRGGIIKPLIKEAAAQEYLYLIVPVDEKQ